MAMGGGTFTAMDKILPGTYINVVSKARTGDIPVRGVAAMALPLDWGTSGKAYRVDVDKFNDKALTLFGYAAESDRMKNLRELFQWATTLVVYNLSSGGETAKNATMGMAKYPGVRGNEIKVTVSANVDDTEKFDVVTTLGGTRVNAQTVKTADQLKHNDFVTFSTTALTAGEYAFSGGTSPAVTGESHQAALTAFEKETFNVIGVAATDAQTVALYTAWTKRMREDRGLKFQLVAYNTAADDEGVINVASTVTDEGADAAALVYWVTGAQAGCQLGKSLTNFPYDGEYTVDVSRTQAQLEDAIQSGQFVFHQVSEDEVHVLSDVNSLLTYTDTKSELFSKNDTIRTIDYLAMQTAYIFNNRYIGSVANNAAGRSSLWSEIVAIHRDLEQMNAISDFDPDDLTVEAGEGKGDVVMTDAILLTGAMEKLYMTVVVE